MTVIVVRTTGPAPRDVQSRSADMRDDNVEAQSLPATQADIEPATRPRDQLSDDVKSVVLQTQDVAHADGASDETLAQLFRTLVDLLAQPPVKPTTKLDV